MTFLNPLMFRQPAVCNDDDGVQHSWTLWRSGATAESERDLMIWSGSVSTQADYKPLVYLGGDVGEECMGRKRKGWRGREDEEVSDRKCRVGWQKQMTVEENEHSVLTWQMIGGAVESAAPKSNKLLHLTLLALKQFDVRFFIHIKLQLPACV